MSLRARLLAVLALLAVVGLAAADIATYAALRQFLVQRIDRTVEAGSEILSASLAARGRADPESLAQLVSTTPGVYVGVRAASGAVRWSPIGTPAGRTPPSPPLLPSGVAATEAEDAPPFTVPAERGGRRYRAYIEPLPGGGQIILAAPLDEVDATLGRLLVIELLVSGVIVAAILAGGAVLVRVGLRPLSRMEGTAAAIAAGDLSRRVEGAGGPTEVGRLAAAFNAMLGRIEAAFQERAASERVLRRFVADASHELRTPLAAAGAYAELFDRGAREHPEDLERAMRGIQRETARMGVLVDDLLMLARLDQHPVLERRTVDLAAIAADAVEAARALAPDRAISLRTRGPVMAAVDPEGIRRVLDNLLANVRAHTPAGTPAGVEVRATGGVALLEVADEGPGMPTDDADHAFERFFRGTPSRSRPAGGTGLGLSIVAAIAEAHGGRASLTSEPGAGTVIRVELPAGAARAPEGTAVPPRPD